MKKKLLFLLVLCLLLAGCGRANNPEYEDEPAGFVDGVWHGLTLGYILLWDTFVEVSNPALYAANNVGYWYNCGFACVAPILTMMLWGFIAGILRGMAES